MRIVRRAALAGVLLALLACAQTTTGGSSSVAPLKPFTPPANWGLFISDTPSFQGAWNLVRLDAGNLKDAQASSTARGYPIASADGSTLAEIDYSRNAPATVHIIDARSGTERRSFQPPFAALPTLTPDGSRLLLMDDTGGAWSLYDTATGQVVGKFDNLTDRCCGPFFLWLDPAGRYVYRVLVPGSGLKATGPVMPVLIKYGFEAGREIGRLQLTGVLAGVWGSGRTINSDPVANSLVPGVALRGDGAQMSVLYGDGTQLMTIDTTTMRILGSRGFNATPQPTSWLDLRPRDAFAKYAEGTQWNLEYSPDGRHLVAAGRQTMVDKDGHYKTLGIGIRGIDVATGMITAGADSLDVTHFFYAPDGSALYAMALANQGATGMDQTQFVLLRLDTGTLAVAARREFTGSRPILLLAIA